VQGMETILAAFLATVTALLVFGAARRPDHRRLGALSVVALLAVLTRPDLLVFVGICLVGLGAWLVRERRFADLKRALAWLAGGFVLPGLAWAAWRWSYYGYPLPNTAYVKGSGGFTNWLSRYYVRTFAIEFAPPYLLGLAVLSVRAFLRRRAGPEQAGLWAIGTALAAALTYLAATLFVLPIQGDLWRFQMPVFPVLLLVAVLLAERDPAVAQLGMRGGRWARVAAVAGTVALAAFPLASLGETQTQVRGRWTYDREQAGIALEPFRDDGLTMLVTESGMLPYRAGWRTSDLLGLNDHVIATDGPTDAYLESLHPDVIQFVYDFPKGGFPPINRLLASGRFRLANAVVKTNSDLRPGVPPQAHLYFVRSDSPHAAAVIEALRSMRVRRLPAAQTATVLGRVGYRPGPAPRR
jgi:arabinofuranosyltransferase